LYDIQPGNGAGLFLQPRSPHGAEKQQKFLVWQKVAVYDSAYLSTITLVSSIALFPHFNGHFFQVNLMKVVVTTTAVSRAKLQSNHQHQQTNTELSTGWMPFPSPNQQRQSTEGKLSSIALSF